MRALLFKFEISNTKGSSALSELILVFAEYLLLLYPYSRYAEIDCDESTLSATEVEVGRPRI